MKPARPSSAPVRPAAAGVRLNKFLASAGLGSRRSVEQLITGGQVLVNGRVCTELATSVTEADEVVVGGQRLGAEDKMYLLLNKPKGYLCAAKDEPGQNRPTVFDLLPEGWPRVAHAGRLDYDSEGLLILTNDGDFALRLTHPRYKVEKEYVVTLDRAFDPADAPRLLKGVFIAPEEPRPGAAAPTEAPKRVRARAERILPLPGTSVGVVLRQGLKRQIRLMFLALNYRVRRLVRVRIGPLTDRRLPSGQFRKLTRGEIRDLLKAATAVTAEG
ncbi:MAG: rRNA pseudouridine synthase [Verrucomicrobia bacterium]|nr:rRNA pseudouridine synthase [Verrucomicrobiota bacterium]